LYDDSLKFQKDLAISDYRHVRNYCKSPALLESFLDEEIYFENKLRKNDSKNNDMLIKQLIIHKLMEVDNGAEYIPFEKLNLTKKEDKAKMEILDSTYPDKILIDFPMLEDIELVVNKLKPRVDNIIKTIFGESPITNVEMNRFYEYEYDNDDMIFTYKGCRDLLIQGEIKGKKELETLYISFDVDDYIYNPLYHYSELERQYHRFMKLYMDIYSMELPPMMDSHFYNVSFMIREPYVVNVIDMDDGYYFKSSLTNILKKIENIRQLHNLSKPYDNYDIIDCNDIMKKNIFGIEFTDYLGSIDKPLKGLNRFDRGDKNKD
jgi:hypothetical protein